MSAIATCPTCGVYYDEPIEIPPKPLIVECSACKQPLWRFPDGSASHFFQWEPWIQGLPHQCDVQPAVPRPESKPAWDDRPEYREQM